MMMRQIFFSICLVFAAQSLAGGTVSHAAEAAEEDTGKANNRTLDLSGLVLPVSENGKLINYLFISAQVTVSEKYNHWEVREEAHIYRDLILKEAHKTNVGLEGAPMRMDEDKFNALVHDVFDKHLGPKSVKGIHIMTVDSQKVFVES